VGSADLQSLADLGNTFDLVRAMRVIPISRDAVIQIAAAMLAPIAPLLLTMMSPEDLLRALLGLLF
jgi:hypothetical protein